MASPTNLRSEAIAVDSVTLYWLDADSNTVDIHRKITGGSYALVDSVAAGIQNFTDTLLASETTYFYKVTQDSGATFSNETFVRTYKCAPSRPPVANPAFGGEKQQASELNLLAENLELKLQETRFHGGVSTSPLDTCLLCAVDGAIVLDCTECPAFDVIADQDINSITMINCGDTCPPIQFYVPSGSSVGICGWGEQCEFSGDECDEGPIDGGDDGKTGSTDGTTRDGGNRPGGNDDGCPCKSKHLSIKCCSGSCDQDCDNQGCITLKICGGVGPYTVEVTKGSVSGSGRNFTWCPETETVNNFGNTLAFGKVAPFATLAGSLQCRCDLYNCSGVLVSDCISGCADCATAAGVERCSGAGCTGSGSGFYRDVATPCTSLPLLDTCGGMRATGVVCDLRTQEMIDDGCDPCPFSLDGGILTATDARGMSVSLTA